MTADSSLQIITTNTFQNCFVLEFSEYGMQLLGINRANLHKLGARYYLGYQDGSQSAAGEADQFVAVLEEFRKSETVTRQRLYLEAMEDILPGVNKIIVSPEAESVLILGGREGLTPIPIGPSPNR